MLGNTASVTAQLYKVKFYFDYVFLQKTIIFADFKNRGRDPQPSKNK